MIRESWKKSESCDSRNSELSLGVQSPHEKFAETFDLRNKLRLEKIKLISN